MRGSAIVFLASVAGCSFDGSTPISSTRGVGPDTSADAGVTGSADARASASSDASASSTDATPPNWIVVESLVVDTADPEPVFSQTVLLSGVVYRLRASGTITNVIDSYQGDADYFDFNNPTDDGCCEDIGLGIDDTVVNDLDTQPDWGPYDPSHIYEVDWTGDGTTISALFQDTYYGNNIGNLTLEILAFQ